MSSTLRKSESVSPAPPPTPKLPLGKKLLYAVVVSVSTLVLLLIGTEVTLRIVDYGHSPHFFRKVRLAGGDVVYRENRWATTPYFSAALARRPQPIRLPARKAPDTYRIFVLGSSAAMGDPEPSFSVARVLEVMLHAAYPQQKFEVVNAAVTAINSHVVRGIADDCAALEPDLFVVYEGNNEVIGPFGPAGVFAPFLKSERAVRTAIWLKGTRLGQLLANLGRGRRPADWGGMEMFLRQQITADDPRLDIVQAHFRANLTAVTQAAQRAGATTLLCTVATNQRDFPPFLSSEGWAENIYQQAQQALAMGREDEARPLFQRALDLDTLRFRTDSKLNGIIRELGESNQPGVRLVDVAQAIALRSPHGIIGSEFLYEHVHFNLRGTCEFAAALLPAIGADLRKRGLVTTTEMPATVGFSEVSQALGYSTYEQAMIALELLRRFSRPPFTAQSDHATRLASWQRWEGNARALLARADATDTLREIGRRALEQRPGDWLLERNTGVMLLSRGQPAEALPYLERAQHWIDDDVDTLVALGWVHQALGHAAESEIVFARARQLEPDYPNLPKPRAP